MLAFREQYQWWAHQIISQIFWHFESTFFNVVMNILFVTSNHQTTNLVFPNYFNKFFSVWAVEKENKLFIGAKLRKKTCFGPIWKVCFLFQLLKLRKKTWPENIRENKIGGLMPWTRSSFHRDDVRQYVKIPKGNYMVLTLHSMAIRVVEFSNGGYKIRKIFA